MSEEERNFMQGMVIVYMYWAVMAFGCVCIIIQGANHLWETYRRRQRDKAIYCEVFSKVRRSQGLTIHPDRHISDVTRRSWFERLFTLPWTPFERTKHSPMAYVIGKNVFVSPTTFEKIKQSK